MKVTPTRPTQSERGLSGENAPDPTRLLGRGMISLGTVLSPGEYLVQIVVTDENAGPKKPPVAQWVDFEVVAARDSL